jgi:glycosyltransferase involved in cell wall biosynthesis
MPRLLVLCEFPTLLGGERSMLATLPFVRAAEFEVFVAAPAIGLLAEELAASGVPHLHWITHDPDGARQPLAALRGAVRQIVRDVQPHLLHANSLSAGRIAGPVTAERGVPGIGHLRDILKLSTQAISDLNANRKLIAVSQATHDFHVAQGLDAAKCTVINNGIDLTEFTPTTPTGYVHRELQLPTDAQLCAVVGQLGLRKGTDVALAAASMLAHRLPNLHWLIIGERTSAKDESRQFEQSLRRVAASPPLAGRVHFLGTRTDMHRLLPECTLLVHAARQEPLGRVLIEAAACGLAVVATCVGGTREIFPPHANAAALVPPESADVLARAVGNLMFDSLRRLQLGRAARRRAENAFDVRTAAARLIEQYHEALQ